MARIARVVVPDMPHHIIQRGNRRQEVFFSDNDYVEYLRLLKAHSRRCNVSILAYCLMPNHVHLIVVPGSDGNLAQAIGETHRKYTRYINFRENWRGYLWQGRFSSYVLNEVYLLAATRYILLNPVKAKLTKDPFNYTWSSARYHMCSAKDKLLDDTLLQRLIGDWRGFLATPPTEKEMQLIQQHERTGRPLGDGTFIEKLEHILDRPLKKRKPGRVKNTN